MKRFAVVVASLLFAAQAAAQYPSKPIRIIIPFGPGSSTDAITRILAQPVSAAHQDFGAIGACRRDDVLDKRVAAREAAVANLDQAQPLRQALPDALQHLRRAEPRGIGHRILVRQRQRGEHRRVGRQHRRGERLAVPLPRDFLALVRMRRAARRQLRLVDLDGEVVVRQAVEKPSLPRRRRLPHGQVFTIDGHTGHYFGGVSLIRRGKQGRQDRRQISSR